MGDNKKIGFIEAFSIGVGGMVGGGIFAVLGLTILLAKGAAPVSFAIAGVIALITAYSYAKLSVRYPSEGGTIEFMVQAFGNGLFTSVVNNLMLVSYIIMLALYAFAFGSYGSALLMGTNVVWVHKLLAVGVIVVFATVNLFGAFMTGKTEDVMVLVKLVILILFAAVGMLSVHWSHLAFHEWRPIGSVVSGGLIIFLAYEGFELIANTARDIKDPASNLPKAYYASVLFVIVLYVVISIVAVGNLSFATAIHAKDYALAMAAKPFFGQIGFILIGIAALLSTASAINATLYGSGRTCYLIAKLGELPDNFEHRIKHGYEGMLIISLLGILFTLSFDLNNISVAGSLGFLTIFMLVNFANFKLYKETASNRLISGFGTLISAAAIFVLVGYNILHTPNSLLTSSIVILTVILFSVLYYRYKKGKHLSLFIDKMLQKEENARNAHADTSSF
jgi:uncharacterized protein